MKLSLATSLRIEYCLVLRQWALRLQSFSRCKLPVTSTNTPATTNQILVITLSIALIVKCSCDSATRRLARSECKLCSCRGAKTWRHPFAAAARLYEQALHQGVGGQRVCAWSPQNGPLGTTQALQGHPQCCSGALLSHHIQCCPSKQCPSSCRKPCVNASHWQPA
jgi:hypothetical protein